MTWVTGLAARPPGCAVTEAGPLPDSGGRLVVINGRLYRRVELSGLPARRWRLEALELPEAIAWLIREQQPPAA